MNILHQLIERQASRTPDRAAVVGILAILKAGGAYLPIDSAHPPGRIEFVLRDAGVNVMLTQTHLQRYCGPRGCEGDAMLLEPYVPAIADLFRHAVASS
jgi:non-ribosomal peptide synthetase component F